MEALLLALGIFLGSLFSSLVMAMVTDFLDWYCWRDRHLRARVRARVLKLKEILLYAAGVLLMFCLCIIFAEAFPMIPMQHYKVLVNFLFYSECYSMLAMVNVARDFWKRREVSR
jgi:nicotinamide riboside transporter PnuC